MVWGILSHARELGWHERVRGGGFNPLRGATTGVVMRRRATSGEMARGGLGFVFWFGGFFHTLRSGWHERVRGGGFNPLRGATTGVVMRRRATSGEMARGGGLFFLWRLLRCRRGIVSHARERRHPASQPPCGGAGEGVFGLGDCFTCSGVDGTRGLGVGGLIRCAGRPREWSCGAVPPQERWHEGGGCFFFGGCSSVGGGLFHMLYCGVKIRRKGDGRAE